MEIVILGKNENFENLLSYVKFKFFFVKFKQPWSLAQDGLDVFQDIIGNILE